MYPEKESIIQIKNKILLMLDKNKILHSYYSYSCHEHLRILLESSQDPFSWNHARLKNKTRRLFDKPKNSLNQGLILHIFLPLKIGTLECEHV